MISDNVIKAYPLVGMVERAKTLKFVTENVDDKRFFMSLITPEGSFRILEFDTLQMTTDMTAKFLDSTADLMTSIISDFETKIEKIINA